MPISVLVLSGGVELIITAQLLTALTVAIIFVIALMIKLLDYSPNLILRQFPAGRSTWTAYFII